MTNPNPECPREDPDSVKDAFLQIAEKVKNGESKVVSMGMERDMMSETKLTFEVIVYES